MGHGHSGHTVAKPVSVVSHLFLILCNEGTTMKTLLAVIWNSHTWRWTRSNKITTALR